MFSPSSQQKHQELLQTFCDYLNDYIYIINSIKKSLYQILNISLHPFQPIIQPTLPSISINNKRTLDDLKRISSMLKGYSRSKFMQKEQEYLKKSKISSKSTSKSYKQSKYQCCQKECFIDQKRLTRNGNNNVNVNTNGNYLTFNPNNAQDNIIQNQQTMINMVTFDLNNININQQKQPSNSHVNNQLNSNTLKHYSSQKLFTKKASKAEKKSQILTKNKKSSSSLSKQKQCTQNEVKFKQYMKNQQIELNQIIKRNNQCLSLTKQLKNHIQNKKKKEKNINNNNSQRNNNNINRSQKSNSNINRLTPVKNIIIN